MLIGSNPTWSHKYAYQATNQSIPQISCKLIPSNPSDFLLDTSQRSTRSKNQFDWRMQAWVRHSMGITDFQWRLKLEFPTELLPVAKVSEREFFYHGQITRQKIVA